MQRFEAGESLETLAASGPDPWRVVEEILALGDGEAAWAFAGSHRSPDTAALADYIPKQDSGVLEAVRSAMEKVAAATSPAASEKAIEALLSLRETTDLYLRSRLFATVARGRQKSGHHADASAAYGRSAEAAEQVGWLFGAQAAWRSVAMAAYRVHDYERMAWAFGRRAAVHELRGRPADQAGSLRQVGSVHLLVGDYESALEVFAEAARLVRRTKPLDRLTLGRIISDRGLTLDRLGKFGTAVTVFEEALGFLDGDGAQRFRDQTQARMAGCHHELGSYDESLALQRQVLSSARDRKDRRQVATALGSIARDLLWLEKLDEAIDLYGEALGHARDMDDARLVAALEQNLGYALERRGDLPAARVRFEAAHDFAKDGTDPWLETSLLQNLGSVRHALGEREAGYRLHEQALAKAVELGLLSERRDGHRNLARMSLDDGDAARAIAESRSAIGLVRRLTAGLTHGQGVRARQRTAEVFEIAIAAAVAADAPPALYEFLEAGRAQSFLESLEAAETLRAVAVPGALLDEEREARRVQAVAAARYRAAVRSGKFKAIRAGRKETAAADAAVEAAVRKIQRDARRGADVVFPETSTLGDAQGWLTGGEALVLYALARDQAIALVMTRTAARIVPLGTADEIRTLCDDARVDDARSDSADPVERLREGLLTPLGLTQTTKRILVSPDGPLFQVPFGVLDPALEVVFVPSATIYGHMLELESVWTGDVLAVGDPDYRGRGLPSLPFSAEEVKAIASEPLLGKAATEAGFRKALAGNEHWRAVHVAGHGKIDSQHPLRSALALTATEEDDGWLTALEVFQMRISAEVVTLSACESGRGRYYGGEGLVGLTRAFLFAGSPRVVCSLWKVDDEATKTLMVKFHELTAGGRTSPAAALRAAQAHVRSQEKWKHPYYWGAWVLWGRDR